MDNASKALRIAGAVLLGLMVTSLLLFAHSRWTKYQKTNIETLQNEQASKFNASFDIDRYAYAYLQKTNDSFECWTVFIDDALEEITL